MPHAESDGLLHVSPVQQPFGHVVASQPSAAWMQPACSWKEVLDETPPASGSGGRQSNSEKLAESEAPPPVFSVCAVSWKLVLAAGWANGETDSDSRTTNAVSTLRVREDMVLPPLRSPLVAAVLRDRHLRWTSQADIWNWSCRLPR